MDTPQNFNIFVAFLVVMCSYKNGTNFFARAEQSEYISAVGDPGMRRDDLRVAIESWNQCNEVGEEEPQTGSPRLADCFDIYKASTQSNGTECSLCNKLPYMLVHRVTPQENSLKTGESFLGLSSKAKFNSDLYATEKELYLGLKCQVEDVPRPWHFWMIMLKNGNMDTFAAKCPKNGVKAEPFGPDKGFPCFGVGCMNQPTIRHQYTSLGGPNMRSLKGRFYGSWDLRGSTAEIEGNASSSSSYYSVSWEKEIGKGSWVFRNVLRTSKKYPWLMLYLRSDATSGFSGGYHYQTRGMSKIIPESPKFKVRLTLNISHGGGPNSQFYLTDIGGCWKNNGLPCDGDTATDVTRYSEFLINPAAASWCRPNNLALCPPIHTFPDGTIALRSDTARFPYEAYHLYCSPGNAKAAQEPYRACDPYSNPQAQEIVQILPHSVWGTFGYPVKKGRGWVGDPVSWELDLGALSSSLYFYQDPGSPPAKRKWSSINVGTEIFKDADQLAEWTVSDFDILVPNSWSKYIHN